MPCPSAALNQERSRELKLALLIRKAIEMGYVCPIICYPSLSLPYAEWISIMKIIVEPLVNSVSHYQILFDREFLSALLKWLHKYQPELLRQKMPALQCMPFDDPVDIYYPHFASKLVVEEDYLSYLDKYNDEAKSDQLSQS